ncbi:PoNe immunity protein domain-containing protein [Pseudoalteromonas sp. TB64]|uniref:PoNe immunity protein domain-containing protein n=1 Tax=Pseudoalteromonas sp. TB64 TaxID=1938600 RepID=UPI0004264816|nr:PoNe immunity protein domain-containing protein [Pseudoalteromonas sp. TB64]
MLRDKLRDKDYFDENIEFSIETIEEYIDDLKTDQSLTTESKMKFAFGIVSYLVSLMHERYSRGDNLLEFKVHLDMALEYRQWQKHYADALPENEQVERIQWEELHEDDMRRTLIWLAFAYCLDMGQAYYQQVLELIANQGQDGLLDNIAVAMGDTTREVAQSTLFKKRFGKLYKVVEGSPEQRPALVKAYLDAWYKAEGSPDYHLMDTDAYIGYWCWGAALVVKLYNIDDSSFIDHEYYPKDLVHWQDNK